MFTKILVPVDLTAKNLRAVETARDLAQWRHGEVAILHVIELLDAPMEELEDFYEQLEESARHKIEEFAAPLRSAGVPFAQHIRYGKRVPEILKFAAEQAYDVMVITSHPLDREHPGQSWMTISHQLAILAECPVLVLR